ncbi:TIGR00341 family protein [Mariniblastus fucicola]|uniref:TIGR00341 family protein n=1 Tax=Mariniblastus fucicola TaxID=980251 RepID=A0A5B9PDQ9_9BACT|nr:TIGR00341 family protein [Mariniblastus fucicola]QEG21171.1 hypothetical protein MFFC18_10250 [Mariniblastus fucicola]
MPIAVYINETSQVEPLVNWGIRAAISQLSQHYELLIIVPRRQKGSPKWDPLLHDEAGEHAIFQAVFDFLDGCDRVVLKEHVAEHREAANLDKIVVETRELVAPNPAEAFVDMVETLDSVRLIIPAINDLKSQEQGASWAQRLFLQAPCETMMVWGSPPPLDQPIKVLVAADADTESSLAARRAAQISRSTENGSVALLYVWPDDDEVAPQIAGRKAASIVSGTGSNKSDFETSTFIGDSIVDGVQAQGPTSFDTVIFGSRNIKKIRSLVRGLRNKDDGKSMAVVRPAVSISRKLLRGCQGAIRQLVPQLEREERIELVENLETNSKFNFDFCALISLSTLIAALGLADSSTAVVIGAMLVAPLMTPIVGIGFALIQGNLNLIRNAWRAVLIGFAIAFTIGAFVGFFDLLFTDITTTDEMAARDWPSFLDLFVAFASGIAGAYAMSRKGLNGAIPGVAIAAALIPPIATSGMSLASGNFPLCIGALLLFLTNVVFIVLGTAVVFWSVGIDTRPQKSGSENQRRYVWTRWWFGAFVVLSTLLATWMAIYNPLKTDKSDEDRAGQQVQQQDAEN